MSRKNERIELIKIKLKKKKKKLKKIANKWIKTVISIKVFF